MGEPQNRLAVWVTDKQARAIRAKATVEGISASALVRSILERHLGGDIPLDGNRITSSLVFAHFALDELLRAGVSPETRKAVQARHQSFMETVRGDAALLGEAAE